MRATSLFYCIMVCIVLGLLSNLCMVLLMFAKQALLALFCLAVAAAQLQQGLSVGCVPCFHSLLAPLLDYAVLFGVNLA